MFSIPTKSLVTFLAAVMLLTVLIIVGCQASDQNGQAEMNQSAAPWDADRTLHSGDGYPISMIKRPPQSVQEMVNRNHAIVIGTISAVSGPKEELPYGKTEEDFQDAKYQGYVPRDTVAYYDIAIEEVLMDDGNILAHPRLRLSGAHNPKRPQVGERFLFTLGQNPDSRSYGIVADWDVLTLDSGVRNFDGTSPGYTGVTDEASLVKAIREAVPLYEFMPFSQWPTRFAAVEEDGDGEEPTAPGGPGDDDVGPTGDTGGGSGN